MSAEHAKAKKPEARCHTFKVAMLLAVLLVSSLPVLAQGQAATEASLRAVFLVRLASFTTWPTNATPATNATFVIGILGDDPFGKDLEKAIEDVDSKERKIVIQRYRNLPDGAKPQVLFISNSERRRMDAVLRSLPKAGVLTVGDSSDFCKLGGMARYVKESEEKLRFEFNLPAIDGAQLTVNAWVLTMMGTTNSSSASPPKP